MSVIYGKGTEVWELDDELTLKAQSLVNRYPDSLGHIELEKVVFTRMGGYKMKKSGKNWYGKTWYLAAPLTIIPSYVIRKLAQGQCINSSNIEFVERDLLDLCYVVALNTDALMFTSQADPQLTAQMEEITLHHELLHIKPEMDGLVPHQIQDFAEILDRYGTHWDQGVIADTTATPAQQQALQDFTKSLDGYTLPVVPESD